MKPISILLANYPSQRHHSSTFAVFPKSINTPKPQQLNLQPGRVPVARSIDNHLYHKVSALVLDLARHLEGLLDAVQALVALGHEAADVGHAGGWVVEEVDDLAVGVGVTEDADEVNFAEGGGGHGEGEDGGAHADDHDLAAGLGGLVETY